MSQFSVVSLADHPEYIDVCAAWDLAYWNILNTKRTPDFKTAYQGIAENLQADQIPLTLILMNNAINRPIGMASLWTNDSDHWASTSPWLASLFIHELYRGKNLGLLLIEGIENKARALQIPHLHLTAIPHIAPLYEKLGYEQIDQRHAPEKPGGIEYLLRKTLL